MARQWSARCDGVARQRDGSRQNSIGGLRRAFSPAFFGLVLFIPWRVGAEESGAAKYGFGRQSHRKAARSYARAAFSISKLRSHSLLIAPGSLAISPRYSTATERPLATTAIEIRS